MYRPVRQLIDDHWDVLEPFTQWEPEFARLALIGLEHDVATVEYLVDPEHRYAAGHDVARRLIWTVLTERAAGRPVLGSVWKEQTDGKSFPRSVQGGYPKASESGDD